MPKRGERAVDRVAEARVKRCPYRRLGDLRVDVQRRAQRCRGLEDRPVVTMVEVALTGAAEHQRAVESELGHRSLELLRGGAGRGRGQGGEALEAVGVAVYELGDAIVGLDLQPGGRVGRQVVQARRGEREHLDVQSGLVHGGDPSRSDLTKPLADVSRRDAGRRVGGLLPVPRRQDVVGDEMFLGADRSHRSASPDARADPPGETRFDRRACRRRPGRRARRAGATSRGRAPRLVARPRR